MKLAYEGRNTGHGAFTEHHVYSVESEKEVHPDHAESSRTGHHWLNTWFLPDGEYIVAIKDISNSGKHSCGYYKLTVEREEHTTRDISDVPEWIAPPCKCLERGDK